MFAWQATVQDEAGNVVPFPVVTVYEGDGATLASIFADDGGALDNPLTGSVEGFVQFWAEPGRYKIVGANGGQTQEWEVEGGGLEVAQQAQAAIDSAQLRKNTLDATRAPLPTDDETQGYAPGSRWLWQGQEWVLVDAAAGAAAWDEATRYDVASLPALLANTAPSYPVGTIFATRDKGYSYEVVGSDPDHTTGGGVMLRVLPGADRAYHLGAWGPAVNGTTDDSAKLQAALDRLPSGGGTLVLPRGRIRLNSGVYRKLNAAGALGWGITIRGSSEGNTTIVVGMDDAAITLDGPDGTFASGVTIEGLRFEPMTARTGVGLRLRGIARSDISVYAYRMRIAVECEAFLINTLHVRAQECVQGVNFRKQGHFGGTWGASGCNENHITGDFGKCTQYGLVADTIRGLTADIHVERCGDLDIAGGGTNDIDRGGMKFIDPVGTLRLRGSSEDNGDLEGTNSGRGVIFVETTGAVPNIPWTVHFDGWDFFGTLDRPEHYINITQHGSAGFGVLKLTACSFSDHPSYVPNSARNKIAVGASAPNMRVVMDGVTMTHASTEMSYNNFTDYSIVNSPDLGADTVVFARGASGRDYGHVIQGNFDIAALRIDGNQKIALSTDGARWMRFNSAINAIEFGRGLPGSEVVKHTISLV